MKDIMVLSYCTKH